MGWLRKLASATSSASKRRRAWVDVEQELRQAIDAGVPAEELVEAIAPVLRRRGLDSTAERIIAAATRAKK